MFGNDFDYPIRDRLPPGSGTALHIVRWAIDPGLDGDVYSDKPHLYGPLLSSINVLRVGDKVDGGKFEIPDIFHEDGIVEGGIGEGEQLREAMGVPNDAAQRKKFFLREEKRKDWEFEAGRVHQGDFFNPYIDFNGTWNRGLLTIHYFTSYHRPYANLVFESRLLVKASWVLALCVGLYWQAGFSSVCDGLVSQSILFPLS